MAASDDNLPTVEDRIRQVLIRDWDPLCLRGPVVPGGAYEKYIAPLRELLFERPSHEALVEYLRTAKIKDFAVIGFPRTRERKAARKLLEIKIGEDNKGA